MNSAIPVPQTALGETSDPGGDNDGIPVKVSREWYRFFSLIQRATGGSIDIIGDATAASDSSMEAQVFALQARIDALETRIERIQEVPFRRIDDLEMLASLPR